MAIQVGGTTTVTNERTSTDIRAMSIATTLFFMWGFLTCLNDILIPHLKNIFDLNFAQALLIQFAFFGGYFIFALPAGKLVDRIGYKNSMVVGLAIAAAGAFLFLPAASKATYSIFLAAQVLLATGITILQVAANPYVTSLGPVRTASSRLNFAQAFNSLGTTVAPKFGSRLILGGVALTVIQMRALSPTALQAYRAEQASSVRMPYLGLAITLVVLGVALAILKMPPMLNATAKEGSTSTESIWRHKWLVFSAISIFLYVGAEVSIGSVLINYLGLPEIGHIPQQKAADMLIFYWGGAMVGRFFGSLILQKVKTGTLLGINATMACLLVITSVLTHGPVALWTIMAVGLFNSVMFSNLFTLGLYNLGELTSRGSSLLVMAIVGGGIIPELSGLLADRIGLQHALIVPAICYVFIAIFGFAARAQVVTPTAPVPAVPTE